MLADRHYMREPSYGPRMSLTVILLIINVAVFAGEFLLRNAWSHFPIDKYYEYGALSLYGLKHGFVWQLLTYQFMHASLLHLLLNGLAIFMFGREMEITLGPKKYLTLYFTSGVIGGLLQMLGALLFEKHFGNGPVVGASAAAFGLVAAYATLYPNRMLTMLLFFVFPINLPAKALLWVSTIVAMYGVIVANDGVAHAAHLGGILTGIIFIRYAMDWNFGRRQRETRQAPRELVNASARKHSLWSRPENPPEEYSPTEFISREVDPILDKISAHGIQSLTERERKILDAARKKMAK